MKAVCIIPARGGSKRLPRKNILPLAGEPLLAHTIKHALDSKCFDRVIVSSDDPEILKIADSNGAIAYKRPADLGKDESTVVQVCLDVLDKFPAEDFCCIYATAALLSSQSIINSCRTFYENKEGGATMLMGVSRYNHHPVQAITPAEGGFVKPLFPDYTGVQSQFYPKAYVSNGTFIWSESQAFFKEQTFYGSLLQVFLVPESEVCDIDTMLDYERLISLYER